MRIDQTAIREILSRTDIAAFIGNHVALRKRGNDLVGLCPFHNEKTPSFHVHPDRGFFKCFGCGAGGDVIKFVQLLENASFPEAARSLARRSGIELEPETPGAARVRGEKEQIYAANEVAAAYFHRMLKLSPEAEAARTYCAGRGLIAATIDGFRLGFAPDRWDGLTGELETHGVDPSIAARAGLVKAGQRGFYDFYRGRLMIPTYATTGEVVAFGGRALDGSEPKYLNTSTTPVYTKGKGLYALERARRAAGEREALIVVEGYLDCIALHQAGFTNTVAALGTAFTPDQAAELRKYAERVFVCFDADAAGTAATAKSIDVLMASGCTALIVQLPLGEDPDTFIRAHGSADFQAQLDSALPWIQFKLDREVETIVAKQLPAAHAAQTAEMLVRALPSEEWDRWRVYVAKRLGLGVDDLRRSRFVADPANFAPRQQSGTRFVRHLALAASVPGLERDVLTTLLEEPALVRDYADSIPLEAFKDERYARLYRELLDNRNALNAAADVLSVFGEERESLDIFLELQRPERSSKVRFPDSAARRAHLDRIVERLEDGALQRHKRELGAQIDRMLEAGLPVPQREREEFQSVVERLERSARKRLGTK